MDRNTRQRVSSALLTVTLVFALLAAYYALATGTTATKAFTQSFIFAIALGGATLGVRFWPERQAGPGVLVGGEHPLPQPNVVPAAASSGAGPPFEVAAPFPIGGLAERLQAHDGSNAARAIQINDLVAPAARNGHRKVSPVAIAKQRRRSSPRIKPPPPEPVIAVEPPLPEREGPPVPTYVADLEEPISIAPVPSPQPQAGEASDFSGLVQRAGPVGADALSGLPGEDGKPALGSPRPEARQAEVVAVPIAVAGGAADVPEAVAAIVEPAPGPVVAVEQSFVAVPPPAAPADAPAGPSRAEQPPGTPPFQIDPSAPPELVLELATYWHTRYVMEQKRAEELRAEKANVDADKET